MLCIVFLGAYPLQADSGQESQLNTKSSRQAQIQIRQAEKAEKSGNWDEALKGYMEALKFKPRSTTLAAKIGAIYYNRHDYERALTYLQDALKISPRNFEATKFAGIAAYRLNKFAAAVPLLEKAALLRANDPGVHYWLGVAYYAQGNPGKAVDELRESLRYNQKDIETLYMLGKIQWELSQRAWQEMREIDPDSYRVHQLMAEYYANKGNLPEAIEQYKLILKKAPDIPGFRASLGDLYLRTGQDRDAEEQFHDELKIDGHSFVAYYGLAKLAFQQLRYQDSVEDASWAIREKPEFGEAYLLLGNVYSRMGEYRRAVEALENAAHILPADPSPHYLLMQIYTKLGETELADKEKEAFERLSAAAKSQGPSVH